MKEQERYRLFELAIDDFQLNLEKLRKLYPVKTVCMHGSPLSKISNLDLGPSGIRFAVIGMNSTG